LRDHAQHLNVVAVELVEAAPGSLLAQAAEKLRETFVVERKLTVENQALYSD